MFYICVLFCIHILLFWRTWEITSKSRYLPCLKYARLQVFSDQFFSCVRAESSILSLYGKVRVIVTWYSGISHVVLIHSFRDYRKFFLLNENLDQLGSLKAPFSDTNKMSYRCDWGLNEALVIFFWSSQSVVKIVGYASFLLDRVKFCPYVSSRFPQNKCFKEVAIRYVKKKRRSS